MSVNVERMKEGYKKEQRGSDFYSFDQGDTLIYIHGCCRTKEEFPLTDGINYIRAEVHYGIGKDNSMVPSLDLKANPVLEHPYVQKLLKKKGVKVPEECPVKKHIESGDVDSDEAAEMSATRRYLWGITPIAWRKDKTRKWQKLDPEPCVVFAPKTVFDGISEAFLDNGDITEETAAIFLIVNKKGKGIKTKYKVTVDPETLKDHKQLKKSLRKKIAEAMEEGGICDLFAIFASMVKSPKDIEAMLAGVKVSGDADEFDDDENEDDDEGLESDDEKDEDDEDDEGLESEDDDEKDEDDDEKDEDDDEKDEDDDEKDEDDDEKDEDDDEKDEDDDEKDEDDEDDDEKDEDDDEKDDEKSKSNDDDEDFDFDEIDAELERVKQESESKSGKKDKEGKKGKSDKKDKKDKKKDKKNK